MLKTKVTMHANSKSRSESFKRPRVFLPRSHPAMLRSIALSCVDRRQKPGDDVNGGELEDVLDESGLDMKDADGSHGSDAQRKSSTKLNVKNVMKSHLQGTKRVRTCLFLTPVIMLLVMFTRPLYAPLIDVFGPTEEELRARVSSAAAAGARARFERRSDSGTGSDNANVARRLLRAAPRVQVAVEKHDEIRWDTEDTQWTETQGRRHETRAEGGAENTRR